MQKQSLTPVSKSEGRGSFRSAGLHVRSMPFRQQMPSHFGKDVGCPQLRHSSKGIRNGFYVKPEPVLSTYPNEPISFANSQRSVPVITHNIDDIQTQVKAFVKSMVLGRELSVLSADGQLRACICSFDRRLQNYNLAIRKEMRSIPLATIKDVFQGLEPQDIDTPLDELCATIMLDTGECISFRFGDVKERECFSLCLQIIVDGRP